MHALGTAYFDDVADAATFCAALIREGIAFEMCASGTRWAVRMTGF
jgi:hypothetical protein